MESSNWTCKRAEVSPSVTIAYLDCLAQELEAESRGTVLLIHGFPQTSYQFRHVIGPIADAGYRVIAPDYRGAGRSSKPADGFTKGVMAQDMVDLLGHLGISEPVHVIGHDIGGMIAYALASRHPASVATLNWGECPLPGTSVYAEDITHNSVQQFHFIFHAVPDLPLALVTGRERTYISHFFNKIAYNFAAISDEDLDHYARQYEQPGAMRCAFEVYRAFEQDAKENRDWVEANGKLQVPSILVSGAKSRHLVQAATMASEVHAEGTCAVKTVEEAAHYVAEENPQGFVKVALEFISKHA